MKRIQNIPLLCGVIDSVIIFPVAILFAAAEGSPPKILVQENPGIFFGFLMPLCILIAWRGTAHTKRLITGHDGWVRPAVEGFLAGFLPIPFIQTIGILNEAVAAGPPWPLLGNAIEGEWAAYFLWLLRGSLLTGTVGAVCGLVLSGVNRLLIRWWTANQRQDRPENPAGQA